MEDACKSYPKCGVNALTIETTVNIENSATTHIPIPHRNITTQKIILLRVHRSYICRLTFNICEINNTTHIKLSIPIYNFTF